MSTLEAKGPRDEQRTDTAEVEPAKRLSAALLDGQLLQKRRSQRTMHDQIGIAFFLARIGLVVVDPVPIERQRRVAEEQRGVRNDLAPPFGLDLVSLGPGCSTAR